MYKEKNSDYKLRVPSHMNIVNIRNMKGFIRLLDRLPDEFEYQDVSSIPEYSVNNIVAISRILTYLKYLGILKTIRKKGKPRFKLTETGEELKRIVITRPEKLNEKWSETLRTSELYTSLRDTQEFQKWGYISKSGLKKLIVDSFSKKVKNSEERADKAEQFLVQLLEDAELFTFYGNCLRPIEDIFKGDKEEMKKGEGGLLFINESNFELKIKEWDDLTLDFLNKYTEYKKSHNKTKN